MASETLEERARSVAHRLLNTAWVHRSGCACKNCEPAVTAAIIAALRAERAEGAREMKHAAIGLVKAFEQRAANEAQDLDAFGSIHDANAWRGRRFTSLDIADELDRYLPVEPTHEAKPSLAPAEPRERCDEARGDGVLARMARCVRERGHVGSHVCRPLGWTPTHEAKKGDDDGE
jgi:hypothetical protein